MASLSEKVHLWVEYHRNVQGGHAVCGTADTPTLRVSRRSGRVTCKNCLRWSQTRPGSIEPTINRKDQPK